MMSSSRSRSAALAWTGFSGFSITNSLSSGGFRLGPHAFEHRRDRLGRLGAGDTVPAVDDEEGDAAHAERPGHLLVGLHRLPVLAAGQDGQRLVAVQPHVGRETGERGVVEDRGLIGEVRAVQPLGQLGLPAPRPGQLQQPVRVPGVAAPQVLHAEGQPGLGRTPFHLPLRLAGLLQAQPVLAGQRLDRRRGHPGRRRRVQLERAVDDLDLVAVREMLQRLLEIPLAEVAPRAHDVRPDLDLHGRVNAPRPRSVPSRGRMGGMLDHVSIQCADLAASAAFYDAVLAPLGGRRVLDFGEVIGYGTDQPDFWIGPNTTGGPTREAHLSFTAPDRGAVEAFFAAAVARGAEVLHAPREWPEYHDGYYGAFVRDPDGHNVEAVSHQ